MCIYNNLTYRGEAYQLCCAFEVMRNWYVSKDTMLKYDEFLKFIKEKIIWITFQSYHFLTILKQNFNELVQKLFWTRRLTKVLKFYVKCVFCDI